MATAYVNLNGLLSDATFMDRVRVAIWIAAGKLPAFRTPGGHWRVRAIDVEAIREHPPQR